MQRRPRSTSSMSWYSQMSPLRAQAWVKSTGLPAPQSTWNRLAPSSVSTKDGRGPLAIFLVSGALASADRPPAATRAATAAAASDVETLLLSIATPVSSARGGGVDEADHRPDPAIAGDNHELGARDGERGFCGAAGHPTESEVAVMRFDAARQTQPVAGEVPLRRRDHGVEAVVAIALPRRVDVA